MQRLRESILKGRFPEFVVDFMNRLYPDKCFDQWAVDALKSVNIDLNESS